VYIVQERKIEKPFSKNKQHHKKEKKYVFPCLLINEVIYKRHFL